MPETLTDTTGSVEGAGATEESSPSVADPGKEHPTYICEFCGPQTPADAVYRCTLCAMNYCVNHLAPMAHYCFGALGKPQNIGVSG